MLRLPHQIDAVGIGGGRGLMHVTLPAFKELRWTSALIITTFGTGGSSQMIKEALAPTFGYTFSLGNLAAAYQQALGKPALDFIFGYRLNWGERRTFVQVIDDLIYSLGLTGSTKFVPNSLLTRLRHLAPIINNDLGTGRFGVSLPLRGHSIQNIVLLWHFLRLNVFERKNRVDLASLGRALAELRRFFGLRSVYILPVSIDPGILVARYGQPIPRRAQEKLHIPRSALSKGGTTVIGEYYIDTLHASSPIEEFYLRNPLPRRDKPQQQPTVYPFVREAIRRARKMIVAGGGSLYTSILANLAVEGVLEELMKRVDIPRVLILNPYHLDQTLGHNIIDFVHAIERLANRVLPDKVKRLHKGRIAFEHLFSDIIVNDLRAVRRKNNAKRRLLRLMNQPVDMGEARGAIVLKPAEWKHLLQRGICVHCRNLIAVKPKDVKTPRGKSFEIAGYEATKIARVFRNIHLRYRGKMYQIAFRHA